MIDEDLPATRANLSEVEERKELVKTGKDQLEKVQEKLINEFMDLFERWKKEVENSDDIYSEAKRTSELTRAMEGDVALRGAASARSETVEIESSVNNIAGVKVPQFTSRNVRSNLKDRGYGVLGTSSRIDETADSYEDLVQQIIKIAEIETAMKRILEELEKVKRRVNALDNEVLPALKQQEKEIQRSLLERERQEIYTLKKVKDMKEEEDEQDF